MNDFNPNRYAVINEKNPREIVMLRGQGCSWRKCRFCDYHLDFSPDSGANFALNREQADTVARIDTVCRRCNIRQVHFECHWRHREAIAPFRRRFGASGVELKIKTGVETFDSLFRESYLAKGIDASSPEEIAAYFDEVCLLQGIPGQTAESMDGDIQTGLTCFERVCVNIMQENKKPVKPDPRVIETFTREVYPKYKGNDRVDILMENTAFGVGGVVEHAE